MELKTLFSPMCINKCEIPNRLVVSAMVVNYNNSDGTATEKYISYHEAKAKGGWGLIITENYAVNEHAMGYKYIGGLYNDDQIESHRQLTSRVHKYPTKIFCQLYHAGRQSNMYNNGGVVPKAPSPIPCSWMRQLPEALTVEEIHQIISDFGSAAKRAKAAGFDGVEIHAAHGYLIHEFLSPNSNKRTDEYGGVLINRLRILREIIESVRSNVGDDFPVTVRLSAFEFVEGGRSLFESRTIFRLVEEWGVDAIHVSSGMYGNGGIVSPMFMPHGWITNCAAEAKKVVRIPVITVNRINDPLHAEDIVSSGIADFVAMGRGSLADPDLPNKALSGDYTRIRHCIGCLQGCIAMLGESVDNCVHCLVNPGLGHEFETDMTPVSSPKRVFIAGGGPGGMEFAITAIKKGHNVTLFESTGELGGQFISAAYPPYKGDFATLTAWQINELKLLGADIRLNTPLTADIVRREKPDTVVIATGAAPFLPDVPGINDKKVRFAQDVLCGKVSVGDNILVIGGGMVGSETASLLVSENRQVAVAEMRPQIAMDMFEVNRSGVLRHLEENHVPMLTETKLHAVTEEGALLEKHGTVTLYPCDTVVIAVGTRSVNGLEGELGALPVQLITIGDSVKPRKALDAMEEAFHAALKL